MGRIVHLECHAIRLRTGWCSSGLINDPSTYSDVALWAKLGQLERTRDRCLEAALNAWAVVATRKESKGRVTRLYGAPHDVAAQFIEATLRAKGLLSDRGAPVRWGFYPDGTARWPPMGLTHTNKEPPKGLHSRHLWRLLRDAEESANLFLDAALNGWVRTAQKVLQPDGSTHLEAVGVFASAIKRTLEEVGLLGRDGWPIAPYDYVTESALVDSRAAKVVK